MQFIYISIYEMYKTKRRATPHPNARRRKQSIPDIIIQKKQLGKGAPNQRHVKFPNLYFDPKKKREKRIYANLIGAAWPLVRICYVNPQNTYTALQYRRLATQVMRTFFTNTKKYLDWRKTYGNNNFTFNQFEAFEYVMRSISSSERKQVFKF
jgi:hypothetical protein